MSTPIPVQRVLTSIFDVDHGIHLAYRFNMDGTLSESKIFSDKSEAMDWCYDWTDHHLLGTADVMFCESFGFSPIPVPTEN